MALIVAEFEVVGTSPLLMNDGLSMLKQQGSKNPIGTKKIPSPDDEAASKVYWSDLGGVHLKGLAFRSALLTACKGRKSGRRGWTGIISGAVFSADEECPLYHPETGKPLKNQKGGKYGYAVHSVRAVIQRQGIIRSRPMYAEWACRVRFVIDGEFIPDVAPVTELFAIAGRTVGVGDWRPEKRGSYGRFKVRLVGVEPLADEGA